MRIVIVLLKAALYIKYGYCVQNCTLNMVVVLSPYVLLCTAVHGINGRTACCTWGMGRQTTSAKMCCTPGTYGFHLLCYTVVLSSSSASPCLLMCTAVHFLDVLRYGPFVWPFFPLCSMKLFVYSMYQVQKSKWVY